MAVFDGLEKIYENADMKNATGVLYVNDNKLYLDPAFTKLPTLEVATGWFVGGGVIVDSGKYVKPTDFTIATGAVTVGSNTYTIA